MAQRTLDDYLEDVRNLLAVVADWDIKDEKDLRTDARFVEQGLKTMEAHLDRGNGERAKQRRRKDRERYAAVKGSTPLWGEGA